MKRINRREWRAIAEAISFRLAGEYDEGDIDAAALESAHEKASERAWADQEETDD